MIDLRTYLKERLEDGSVTLSQLNSARNSQWFLYDLWNDYIDFLTEYPDREDAMMSAINDILNQERNRGKKKKPSKLSD